MEYPDQDGQLRRFDALLERLRRETPEASQAAGKPQGAYGQQKRPGKPKRCHRTGKRP